MQDIGTAECRVIARCLCMSVSLSVSMCHCASVFVCVDRPALRQVIYVMFLLIPPCVRVCVCVCARTCSGVFWGAVVPGQFKRCVGFAPLKLALNVCP